MVEFKPKNTYNFSTLAPSRLGARYENMKVISQTIASEAMKYREIYTLHAGLVSVIPNLPDNPADCNFLILENRSGEKVVLALEYIDPASVELVESVNIRIELLDVNTSDLSVLSLRLKELGYTNANITTY